MDLAPIERTRRTLVETLLTARTGEGTWEGELSSSALSTATAVIALSVAGAREDRPRVARGLAWLADHQNGDGGFGDTTDSPTNVATTTLAWVALGLGSEDGGSHPRALERARSRLTADVGELTPGGLARSITAAYGEDRTFAVPILVACALAGEGRLGKRGGPAAWASIPSLPFELAALPHGLFRWLGLPMVSYAMPALIAIGQVIHHRRPSRNPLVRALRAAARGPTLRRLTSIQPTSGGFLEATPLTSFVVASLVGAGRRDHPVAERGLAFLRASLRPDGSWPIDTNLATWVTTQAIDALAAGGRLSDHLDAGARRILTDDLLAQQYTALHPYTHAAPGGWAWTALPGGVPDADDTAGALVALAHLNPPGPVDREKGVDRVSPPDRAGCGERAAAGVAWLLDLQNRDGGIPTFCRGWGRLPFDRSTPDLTAHALRAWSVWLDHLPPRLSRRVEKGRERAIRYLVRSQRADGAWVPLWFGSQHEPHLENPLYGTARVLAALAAVIPDQGSGSRAMAAGVGLILAAQGADGGWGAAAGLPPSIEETALAVNALGAVARRRGSPPAGELLAPIARGAAWLARETGTGTRLEPSPIGLYFAKLWYSERLYPPIFAAAALERASRLLSGSPLG